MKEKPQTQNSRKLLTLIFHVCSQKISQLVLQRSLVKISRKWVQYKALYKGILSLSLSLSPQHSRRVQKWKTGQTKSQSECPEQPFHLEPSNIRLNVDAPSCGPAAPYETCLSCIQRESSIIIAFDYRINYVCRRNHKAEETKKINTKHQTISAKWQQTATI